MACERLICILALTAIHLFSSVIDGMMLVLVVFDELNQLGYNKRVHANVCVDSYSLTSFFILCVDKSSIDTKYKLIITLIS